MHISKYQILKKIFREKHNGSVKQSIILNVKDVIYLKKILEKNESR